MNRDPQQRLVKQSSELGTVPRRSWSRNWIGRLGGSPENTSFGVWEPPNSHKLVTCPDTLKLVQQGVKSDHLLPGSDLVSRNSSDMISTTCWDTRPWNGDEPWVPVEIIPAIDCSLMDPRFWMARPLVAKNWLSW
ncbi:hypothetical protein OGAPHI_004523 [Ogataea philodendri]|uniref:Uncharacterized protein n=1 Tax=Ogataea philodendri TaxID=1378263 RepID=A0A9P8T5I8_9ASCO|nr:uncharacterized protein OGAPHI_004523 [Ogataea philodendri]KAH3666334.1 hypothetical protein OGAPHI_004523 [Ogataea philodendri]